MGSIVFSLFLGLAAVLQGMMNRQISNSWGLATTIVFNNFVLLGAGLVIYFVTRSYPHLVPEFFRVRAGSGISWYFFLPGLFGILLVAGIPFIISKIGALNVFVGMVCAQVVVSLLLDFFIDNVPFTWNRILGATFTVIGVMLFKVKL